MQGKIKSCWGVLPETFRDAALADKSSSIQKETSFYSEGGEVSLKQICFLVAWGKEGIGMWVIHSHLLPYNQVPAPGHHMIACFTTSCEACKESTLCCPASPQPLNLGDKRSFLALQMMWKVRFIFPSLILSMNTWTNNFFSGVSAPNIPLYEPFGPSLGSDNQWEEANRLTSYHRGKMS